MKSIKINSEYITLGQFLKFADIVNSGGMVKPFLEDETIYVENELENRRGKKLYPGMKIEIKGYGVWKIESN